MEHSHLLTDTLTADISILFKRAAPWVLKTSTQPTDLQRALESSNQGKLALLVFDGHVMRSREQFYDELVRKVPLPDYFGRNFNALRECLTDPDVMTGGGYVLYFNNSELILVDEPISMADGLLDLCRSVGAEWANTQDYGAMIRSAAPFHSVFRFNST